jgi:putative PIN family toxin of toxin-antitoxin system
MSGAPASRAGRAGVVFDCNVLLQAAARPDGPAAACLRLLDANRITVYVSRATIKELKAVFAYPSVRAGFPELTDEDVVRFLDQLLYRTTLMTRVRHVLDYPRAPQDEPYIDLAATAQADYLVSRDKDLLTLMTGHSVVCKQFRQKTHPLKVVDPTTLLRILSAEG